jgi:putative toxin-antitoxin system antitoxin component (TIGR02293 family)
MSTRRVVSTTKGARPKAALAAREGHATSNEATVAARTAILALWANKTGTRRTAQDAVGRWLAFRDAIVDEPAAVQIELIRAGVLPSFLVGAAEALGVSRETIFRVVGLSVSTANRKIAKQETLDPLVTERLARLALIEKQADDAFGDPEAARAWLRAENIGLGGCTPLSMLDTDIGSREVAKILVAIAHGGAA